MKVNWNVPMGANQRCGNRWLIPPILFFLNIPNLLYLYQTMPDKKLVSCHLWQPLSVFDGKVFTKKASSQKKLPHLLHTQDSSLRSHWGSLPLWWWCSLCPSLSGGPGRRETTPAWAHPETAAACQTAGTHSNQCKDTVIIKVALWGHTNTTILNFKLFLFA